MAYPLRYLIPAIALAVAAPAQPSVPPPAVRFTVFSSRPIAQLAFVPRPDAAAQTLAFYPTARSPRYEYRGEMPLRFIDPTTGGIVAEATIPPTIRQAFLLFSPIEPSAPGSLRYRIAVLDDSAVRQGSGGLAIINLSGLDLSGTVDGRAVPLKPGLNPAIPARDGAAVTLHTTFRERRVQSHSGTVRLAAGERALLLLFPPFYAGSLEVQSRLLTDQPPAPETPASAPR